MLNEFCFFLNTCVWLCVCVCAGQCVCQKKESHSKSCVYGREKGGGGYSFTLSRWETPPPLLLVRAQFAYPAVLHSLLSSFFPAVA